MTLTVLRAFGWGGVQLKPGAMLSGEAADFVWNHPMMRKNVGLLPDSIKDSHHRDAPISDVPQTLQRFAAKKPEAPQPTAPPAALATVTRLVSPPPQVVSKPGA